MPTKGRFVGMFTVSGPTNRGRCHAAVTPILLRTRSYFVVFCRSASHGLTCLMRQTPSQLPVCGMPRSDGGPPRRQAENTSVRKLSLSIRVFEQTMTAIHPRPEGRGILACDSYKFRAERRVRLVSTLPGLGVYSRSGSSNLSASATASGSAGRGAVSCLSTFLVFRVFS